MRIGGDVKNKNEVLGQYVLTYGNFRGKTFKWLAENALGYAGFIVNDIRLEQSGQKMKKRLKPEEVG